MACTLGQRLIGPAIPNQIRERLPNELTHTHTHTHPHPLTLTSTHTHPLTLTRRHPVASSLIVAEGPFALLYKAINKKNTLHSREVKSNPLVEYSHFVSNLLPPPPKKNKKRKKESKSCQMTCCCPQQVSGAQAMARQQQLGAKRWEVHGL